MEHSTWDLQYNKVFHLFRNNEKIIDKNLNAWFHLWNRAYQTNRMKNEEYRYKWETLKKIGLFHNNLFHFESFLKNGKIPNINSKDIKEKKLALWFEEQQDAEKCIDNLKIDILKSNYSNLFNHNNQKQDLTE